MRTRRRWHPWPHDHGMLHTHHHPPTPPQPAPLLPTPCSTLRIFFRRPRRLLVMGFPSVLRPRPKGYRKWRPIFRSSLSPHRPTKLALTGTTWPRCKLWLPRLMAHRSRAPACQEGRQACPPCSSILRCSPWHLHQVFPVGWWCHRQLCCRSLWFLRVFCSRTITSRLGSRASTRGFKAFLVSSSETKLSIPCRKSRWTWVRLTPWACPPPSPPALTAR
mmetsp:Transcript_31018/g.71490  ORF Transcript_31018/g.71490 Transcript_31018/m.71490 type:complete len:219 (+) Transcript_31018:267-923(+)